MPADQALAQRLRELRLRSGLTQTQVARAIGVTKGTLSQYENGHTRIPCGAVRTIIRISRSSHLHRGPSVPGTA
jgi:transcriptional regulator with XRE-family HTH domain